MGSAMPPCMLFLKLDASVGPNCREFCAEFHSTSFLVLCGTSIDIPQLEVGVYWLKQVFFLFSKEKTPASTSIRRPPVEVYLSTYRRVPRMTYCEIPHRIRGSSGLHWRQALGKACKVA